MGSTVNYTSQNEIGSTLSTTKSWVAGYTIEAATSVSFLGFASQELSASFGKQWGNTRTDAVDIVETWMYDSQFTWPKTETIFDYVNHDDDQFLILFNLQNDMTITPKGTTWAMNARPPPYLVERIVLTVGQLRGTQVIDAEALRWLAARGVTSGDFPEILKSNPFASDQAGLTRPDPARFEPVAAFNYQWNLAGYNGVGISNEYRSTTTTTSEVTYTVKASLEGEGGFLDAIKGKLKLEGSFSWSHSSANTSTTSSHKAAAVTLAMPSLAYSGPPEVYVYVDKVFKTLMFSFVPPY